MRTDIAAANLNLQRGIAAIQQTQQFNHAFTRHNHRMTRQRLTNRHGADGQTVTVSGHGAQLFPFGFKHHAVEVVTHILMRHRKLGRFDQPFQGRLRQGEFNFTLPVVKIREVTGGQGRQRKTAAARAHQHAIAFQCQSNFCAIRQSATDIEEFTRRNGGGSRLMCLSQRHACDHLHFQIGTGQQQRTFSYLQQQVSEDRQRRTTTQGATYLLQRLQQLLTFNNKFHSVRKIMF